MLLSFMNAKEHHALAHIYHHNSQQMYIMCCTYSSIMLVPYQFSTHDPSKFGNILVQATHQYKPTLTFTVYQELIICGHFILVV